MTEIPIGYVGVVISFVGGASQDVSGAAFTHGNLVNPGNKGVWVNLSIQVSIHLIRGS